MFEDKNNNARVHPIDPRELEFGSFIAPEQIENAYNVFRRDYKDFNLARMQMRGFIEKHLPDTLGVRVFVKNCQDGLRILHPNEVADEMQARNQRAIRSIRKSSDVGSDTVQLPDLPAEERRKIASQMNLSSVMSQAFLREKKKQRNLLPKPCDGKPFNSSDIRTEGASIDEYIEENED